MTYDSKIVTMPQHTEEKKPRERSASQAPARTSLDGDEAHQWAMSVVLAFESMSRVVKLSADREKDSPRFEEEWTRLCNFVRDCASDLRTAEVGEASLATLHVLRSGFLFFAVLLTEVSEVASKESPAGCLRTGGNLTLHAPSAGAACLIDGCGVPHRRTNRGTEFTQVGRQRRLGR